MFEIINLSNAILLYDCYNYYLIIHSVTSGIYITYKVFKVTGKFINYLTKKNKIIDDWILV